MSSGKSKSKDSQSAVLTVQKSNSLEVAEPDSAPEASFQNLRQKIEGQLKSAKAKPEKKSVKETSKSAKGNSKQEELSRGTKRKHSGDTKREDEVDRKKPTTQTTKLAYGPKSGDLKDIIAELGGTEEDLELIDGVESDSEMEGQDAQPTTSEPRKGKTLESGMANILKEIALVKNTYKDDESEEEGRVKVNGTVDSTRPQADDKASRASLSTLR